MNDPIVIIDGARTPIGSFGGDFASVPAHELGAVAARAAMERSKIDPHMIEEVVIGCIGQVGSDAYISRRIALEADIPINVPAYTVNRLCGSGLQSIWSAAMQLHWGGIDFALAGGAESMTRMPFYDFSARAGMTLGDRTLKDGTVMILTDPFSGVHMGVTAENVARTYQVSREAQDEFALQSQQRAASEAAQRAFKEEIVAVEVAGKKPVTVTQDQHPRPNTSMEALGKLRSAFEKDGTVTAGNASGINDGGAAVVLTRASVAQAHGLQGGMQLEAVATAAMEPHLMGYAPVPALEKLFAMTGTTPKDIGIVELNEAFASQAVAVIRDAGLDPEKTNPYGGAIALGHPVGATGTMLSVRVLKHLQRSNDELGIVTMCIGGGQALAALFRRI